MNIEFEWKKEDLKKELYNKRKKFNIVFLIVGILLYLYFIYYPLTSSMFDKKYLLAYGLAYLASLLLLIYVFTKIYVFISLRKNDKNTNKAYGLYRINIDNNSINVSINDLNYNYNLKDVILRKKNNYFVIYTKEDKIGLTFKKSILKEKYNEVLNIIENCN